MELFGHRGAAGLVAENTLESVAKALDCNVDGVEIDIHCCKSGELVVIHDETLDRTTNGTGNIANFTLQELQQFTTPEGFLIPTLGQVLDLIDAQCTLNIELKGKHTVGPVVQLLEQYIKHTDWRHTDIIISSFDHEQLFTAKKMTSQYKIGVLTEDNITEAFSVAKKIEAFSIHPPVTLVNKECVDRANAEGFAVYVWTVNDYTMIQNLKSLGVTGVITDFPDIKV